MTQLQPTSPAETTASDLAPAVALVFSTFARLFGPKWLDVGRDPKALPVWERAFQLAGLSAPEVRAGLARASQLEWPPSAGQFVRLCRAPIPTEADALREAMDWARDERVEWDWSHVVVGAAARQVGNWYLLNSRPKDLAKLWANTYREMADRHERGEPLELPMTRVLPAPPAENERARRMAEKLGLPPQITDDMDRASRSIIDQLAARFGRNAPSADDAGETAAA